MYLSIRISRLSNLLFFAQKTDRHNLIKFDLQKYLINENINLLFYEENKNKVWKQIEESIGIQKAEQVKKSYYLVRLILYFALAQSIWAFTFMETIFSK